MPTSSPWVADAFPRNGFAPGILGKGLAQHRSVRAGTTWQHSLVTLGQGISGSESSLAPRRSSGYQKQPELRKIFYFKILIFKFIFTICFYFYLFILFVIFLDIIYIFKNLF